MNKIEVEKAVETHADTIWRLAWIHCNRVQENAEDVFQETFLALVRSKKTFASEEHLKAWLIRCTINRCKDIFKSFRFKHVVALDDAEIVYESPEESTVFHEVMNLPEKYRIVIHLF